jgi:hypothetical protein
MSERPPWRQLPNGLSVTLVVLLVGAIYLPPSGDLDFSWQIRTGEEIVRTGRLQPPESFSYTIAGRPVPDFEWLYEVILWAVWTGFGFGGLKLLKTLLVAATLVLVGLRLRREGVRWHGIALAGLTVIFALGASWNLRPLYCTTLGLLLVSGWLHDHCTGRRPLSGWLPVAMLLWANLHPGVILGQALLVGAIAWEWLNRWVRLNTLLDRAACWRLTWVGGLGLAATLLSPEPLERLLYPFQPELRHPIMRAFGEMNPLYSLLRYPPMVVMACSAYLVLGLAAVTVAWRFRHYRLWEVALLVGLAGLANLAIRSLQDCLLVTLALTLPHLAVLLMEQAKGKRRQVKAAPEVRTASPRFAFFLLPFSFCLAVLLRIDRFCKRTFSGRLLRFQWFWPAAAVGLLAAVSLLPPLAKRMPIQNNRNWPVAALDRMDELGLQGRFFSMPDHGSYVTWRLGARAKVYVDTRGFYFPPELLEDSLFIPQLTPDWRARLKRVFAYGTDYFLLETTGPRGQLWHALQPYIEQPLYCDNRAVVLSAEQVRQGLARLDHARQVPR